MAADIAELKAAVAALTTQLSSCGACTHLTVVNDETATKVVVSTMHGSSSQRPTLQLEYE